jgi:hypothetical protein
LRVFGLFSRFCDLWLCGGTPDYTRYYTREAQNAKSRSQKSSIVGQAQ